MDTELKTKWVDALRGGEFEQAHGSLTDETGAYCCLGVLCQVAGLRISGENSVIGREGRPTGYAPISEILGHVPYFELSERNDGNNTHHPHSFSEIAEYIEKNL